MPPRLDQSTGVTMTTVIGDNENNYCHDKSAAILMLREKYGGKKIIATSPSTGKRVYH